MDKKEFAKKLIDVRRLKGLTQEEVAELSSVTLRTIQRIENEEVIPRASTIKLISNALGFQFFIVNQDRIPAASKMDFSFWGLKYLFNFKKETIKKKFNFKFRISNLISSFY